MSACEELDGMPKTQVTMFQVIAPISAAKITCGRDDTRIDDARSKRFGDVQSEEEEGYEVEERRPENSILRPEHASRNDGRDRIGRIVQSR